ncbi:MAG: hypothetical protein FJ297_13435 [Planctomycetes bacterium]|nr:hypothetical protein [Planctomycetota bacterium]
MARRTTPFTLRRLPLWLLFVLAIAALFSVLPTSSTTLSVVAMVAAAFVAIDVKLKEHFRGRLGISYFACALSYVVLSGLVTILHFPPVPPLGPRTPFGARPADHWSDVFLREVWEELAFFLVTLYVYQIVAMACAFVSTTVALLCWRHNREAKWLLVMNIPGIILVLYWIATTVCDVVAPE